VKQWRTGLSLNSLEEPYRSRAVPPGTVRYWSWLFAAPARREPLLGMYALMAEWRALLDPATEPSVAQVKLGWWHDELTRLGAGEPLHPVTRYLAALRSEPAVDWRPLDTMLAASAAQLAGVPLERGAELAAHADALYGAPLRMAARIGGDERPEALQTCTAALARGEYLSRALADYPRDIRSGRMPFPIEDLLSAQIVDEDFAAPLAPPRLAEYLAALRLEAADCFTAADAALAATATADRRHLAVLCTLGARHLAKRTSSLATDIRVGDVYKAWQAARRAARAH
jgi:phytoene synthase